jgi:3-deoxy-D-manno-octulosonic acid kinase
MIVSPPVAEPKLTEDHNSVILYDADRLENISSNLFQESYWRTADKVVGEASGRGSVIFVRQNSDTWVLRHYHRGGFVGRFVRDRYLWRGVEQTRAFREWRLLFELRRRDLPVPAPVAAHVRRQGMRYTADIITVHLADTRSFESIILNGTAVLEQWSEIGRTLRQFHDHGVNHTDLNIRNILLDENEKVFLIDFDKGEFRDSGSWRNNNLRRLKRSLRKLELETGTTFDAKGWLALERGYESA